MPDSGIDLVFDAGLKKVGEQINSVDSLDVKMGVLIGFLGALIVGALAALLASDPDKLRRAVSPWGKAELATSGVFIAGSLYFAFQAFRMRQYYPGIRFQNLLPWTNEDDQSTKKAFLPTLLKAVELNEQQLEIKQKYAKRAVWSVFLALFIILIATAQMGSEILRRRAAP